MNETNRTPQAKVALDRAAARTALEHEGGPDVIVVPAAHLERVAGAATSRAAVDARSIARARPRRAIAIAVAALSAVAVLQWSAGDGEAPRAERWTFTESVEDPAALGLHTSTAPSGPWRLEDQPDATGARALVNGNGRADAPAATALSALVARDVRVGTRCKPMAEVAERACGVVLRWADERHHYVSRVDASAGTVTLALVFAGRQRTLGVRAAPIALGGWHHLAVEARGDHLVVELDGARVIEVNDPSLPNAGRAGLWSAPAGAAHFDELSVASLQPLAHPTELLPFLL